MNDKTGKNQFFLNATVSWGVHFFIIIAGFIVPRQIDRSLGAEQLGIWDFGWASVQYMTLAGFGVGAALNRYVALHRAAEDHRQLIQVTTAAFIWQVFVALLVVVATLLISVTLPYWAKISEPEIVKESQILVLLLGFSLGIRMLFDHTRGILTGYHYWWLMNGLLALQDFILALVMVGILFLGGGLLDLGIAVLIVTILITIAKIYSAKHFCPDAVVDFKQWDKRQAIELLRFGAKNMVDKISVVIIFQTAAMFLIALVSPAALAVFNRCMALVKHIDHLIVKLVRILVPITSSLIGMKKSDEAKGLLMQSTQMSMALTLPAVLLLVVYGDLVLELWMGPSYASKALITILALGAIIPVGMSGSLSVIAGFNAHGKLSLLNLLLSVIFLAIGSIILNFTEWNVINVAIMCAFSWTVSRLIAQPYYIKQYFKIGHTEYLAKGLVKPLIMNVPMLAALYLSREFFSNTQYGLMLIALFFAAFVTLFIYWRYLLTDQIRYYFKNGIRRKLKLSV